MPIIDAKRGVLVIRVVYDGPPMSGKTTSLRTLARGLGAEATTPEERDGRTMFFDWVDYVGGLFEGRQIRCQIVSVPGQAELAPRRRELLSSADAVVLVADTRASTLGESFALLHDLMPYCRSKQPPIGVVVQANKRDAPDAVPRDRLRAELDRIAPLAIVDTVATAGDGIREAFVFAVRLALDRVRAFAEAGQLPVGEPEVHDAAGLLERLKALPLAQAKQPAPASDESPFVPDPMMPGGFIWPPVDGRLVLHEVAKLGIAPAQTATGDWSASEKGCLFHSARTAIFSDADSGRRALIEWARLHAIHGRRLSPGRTVILAEAGRGRFRLWQLVRPEQTLSERLSNLPSATPQQAVRELLDAASHLLHARVSLYCDELRLPCTLSTISGNLQMQPRFVGLMPPSSSAPVEEPSGEELVMRELSALLSRLRQQRTDFAQFVRAGLEYHERERNNPAAAAVARLLVRSAA